MSAHMNKHNTSTTPAVASVQLVNPLKPLLKIALDVHLDWYVIACQEDGASPKPPQRFKPVDFLHWVKQKVAAGHRLTTCYEAGPFGYLSLAYGFSAARL